MISIEAALARVLDCAACLDAHSVVLEQAVGRVLAEPVCADLDSPPYDKALMDGYALAVNRPEGGERRWRVVGQVVAGQVPDVRLEPGTAVRIMTGAALPAGTDAVVMREATRAFNSKEAMWVEVDPGTVTPGSHLLRQGAVWRAGDSVAPAGHLVRDKDIGLLSEAGCREPACIRPARVAVISTGSELVRSDQQPGPGQIRNSNGPMLQALAAELLAEVTQLGICGDDLEQLVTRITTGLDADVLLLSGGVSMGVMDLVPKALEQCGVKQVFHRVRLKPGKPVWFGMRPAGPGEQGTVLVFGLPGNPLASLVCFELLVAPAIRRLHGRHDPGPTWTAAQLTCDYQHRVDRPSCVPAYAEQLEGGPVVVAPLAWRGSADQRPMVAANCLVRFPAGKRDWRTGEAVDLTRLTPRFPIA